jgi:hypothetical protein
MTSKAIAIAAVAMIALVPIKAEAFMFGYMLGSMNGGGSARRSCNQYSDAMLGCIKASLERWEWRNSPRPELVVQACHDIVTGKRKPDPLTPEPTNAR